MEFIPTRIPDVVPIAPRLFSDEHGFFMETWNARSFAEAGIDCRFLQDNHSRCSVRDTLRSLHYQVRQLQCKLVRVMRGEVFDVAVAIRPSSPAFGEWMDSMLELRRDA